jgi:sulfate adenylyltransferase subunit 2
MTTRARTHLRSLEAHAIHIFREAVATSDRPVLLYSIGKDSSVLLHLARKAFAPAPPPFPLLHVDTTWKFREMIAFRDRAARESGMELIVHVNEEGARRVNPFTHDAGTYTDVMKTQALKAALARGRFDVAIGGARRDEERSRAKERVVSLRDAYGRWDPRRQQPELWNLYADRARPGESRRVFPLSDWTERDVWRYVLEEGVEVVDLYLARPRPVVEREGALIMVDDERFPLRPGEVPRRVSVRFRTLGCYPLTGAVRSDARTLEAVVAEMERSTTSERQGRLIDHDQSASMERKKREGYF